MLSGRTHKENSPTHSRGEVAC